MSEPVDTLWTAGWDSTHRVAELLLTTHAQVRPWYVIDPNRRSWRRELDTIDRLRCALASTDATTSDRLLPLQIRHRDDIAPDPDVTRRYNRLRQRAAFGSQYEWLGRLAKTEDRTLEMGLKADDMPTAFLRAVVSSSHDVGRFAVTEKSDDDLLLFERFRFPLFDVTKADMLRSARAAGFADLLELTWSCHSPLLSGRACGWCGPCRHARDEGFGWRVPRATQARRLQRLGLEGAAAAIRVTRGHLGASPPRR